MTQMTTTVPMDENTSYGLGLMQAVTPCGDAWGHGGSTLGFATYLWASPDGERTFASAATAPDLSAAWKRPHW